MSARYEASEASRRDQLRVENELTKLGYDLANLSQLNQSAKARINSLLNRRAGATIPLPRYPSLPAANSLQVLLAHSETLHPEVSAVNQRAAAFRERLKKAKLERFPDPTLGLQYASVSSSGLARSANGRDQLYATIGFNIPLWQEPRKAMVKEATAGLAETKAMLQATRAELRYRIEDAYFRAKTAREVIGLFEEQLIPTAKQTHTLTLASYSAGTASFTEVIETPA